MEGRNKKQQKTDRGGNHHDAAIETFALFGGAHLLLLVGAELGNPFVGEVLQRLAIIGIEVAPVSHERTIDDEKYAEGGEHEENGTREGLVCLQDDGAHDSHENEGYPGYQTRGEQLSVW